MKRSTIFLILLTLVGCKYPNPGFQETDTSPEETSESEGTTEPEGMSSTSSGSTGSTSGSSSTTDETTGVLTTLETTEEGSSSSGESSSTSGTGTTEDPNEGPCGPHTEIIVVGGQDTCACVVGFFDCSAVEDELICCMIEE